MKSSNEQEGVISFDFCVPVEKAIQIELLNIFNKFLDQQRHQTRPQCQSWCLSWGLDLKAWFRRSNGD